MSSVLLRIGEFARLAGLAVRTVRYYSDLGLLPPTEVDAATGYRYYGLDRIELANRLVALRQLGLPIEEMRAIVDDQLDDRTFTGLLEAHIERLTNQRRLVGEQIEQASALLAAHLKRTESPMTPITVKTSEPRTIVFYRNQIDDISGIGPMFPTLFSVVDPADAVGVAGSVYHEFADDGSFIDLEAALPVADDYRLADDAPEGFGVRRVEATQVAMTVHHGAFKRLHEPHAAVLQWITDNGYRVTGPSYEWNLVCTEPVTQDNESYVTEIHYEIESVAS